VVSVGIGSPSGSGGASLFHNQITVFAGHAGLLERGRRAAHLPSFIAAVELYGIAKIFCAWR